MYDRSMPPARADRTLMHLRELIEALDRRVPQIASAGELEIAREAAIVRDRAIARIRELEAAAIRSEDVT